MTYVNILGVKINVISTDEALKKVAVFLKSDSKHMIFTPNPEMLVDAQKDEYFKEVLNEADMNLCDGRGLELVSRGRLQKITGTDFMQEILALAEQKNYSVYFLGSGKQDVLEQLECSVRERFPSLQIAGSHVGPKITIEQHNNRTIANYDREENNEIIANIVMSKPDIIFVAFGHNKQEKWIYENLADLPSVNVAMGVGGAFDYISGTVKRAPRWMRKIGLEWLFRLIMQPTRVGRIFKATVVFLSLYIVSLIKGTSVN